MIDWTAPTIEIYLLKATLVDDLEAMNELYLALDEEYQLPITNSRNITLAYYLYRLYNLYEGVFTRLAEYFGHAVEDKAQWHSELTRCMATDFSPTRPAVIRRETLFLLNKLRYFRHFFRSGHVLHFDPDQLEKNYQAALAVRPLYHEDLANFMIFLDGLMEQ